MLAEAAAERHLRSSIRMLLSGPNKARELLQRALSMASDQGMLRLQADVLADLVEMQHNFIRCGRHMALLGLQVCRHAPR